MHTHAHMWVSLSPSMGTTRVGKSLPQNRTFDQKVSLVVANIHHIGIWFSEKQLNVHLY